MEEASPRTCWVDSNDMTGPRSSLVGLPFGGSSALDAALLQPPSTLSPIEKRMRIPQFIARLRQPLGAPLLAPTRRNTGEYRRVATESLITVQVEEITPATLDKLINRLRNHHDGSKHHKASMAHPELQR